MATAKAQGGVSGCRRRAAYEARRVCAPSVGSEKCRAHTASFQCLFGSSLIILRANRRTDTSAQARTQSPVAPTAYPWPVG